MKRIPIILAVATAGTVAFLACSEKKATETTEKPAEEPKVEYMVMGEYVNPEDSLPRIRYFADDQISLNDRCAVRKVKLNPKMPPLYVNGQPVGFC